MHGSPHHSSETSPEMLEWVNEDFSDGDKLLDVIHKFKPTVRSLAKSVALPVCYCFDPFFTLLFCFIRSLLFCSHLCRCYWVCPLKEDSSTSRSSRPCTNTGMSSIFIHSHMERTPSLCTLTSLQSLRLFDIIAPIPLSCPCPTPPPR